MKTNKQFAHDTMVGKQWEMQLHAALADYLPGLTPPAELEVVDGLPLGGWGYEPDMRLEVSLEAKVRLAGNFKFTCAKDYPFDSIIVNEVYKTHPPTMTHDEYLRLPIADQVSRMKPFHSYWIASADLSHVAVIAPSTKPCWFQQEMWSPKDRRTARNWLCPLVTPAGRPIVLFGKFPEDIPKLLTRL